MNDTDTTDRLYVDKVHQYTVDPAFDGCVLNYLRTMADEFKAQTAHYLERRNYLKAGEANARYEAYTDAVRVLADADDAAYRFATNGRDA